MKGAAGGKRDMKVLLLGSSNAGKSSLAVMFERKYFSKTYEQTMVLETHSRELLVDGQVIHLEILDCGAPNHLPEYTQYIKNADGLVAVYDITSLPSFSKIEPIVRYAQQHRHCPCILVGNKQDLEKERAIRPQDGTALANDLGCPYLEITATSEFAVTEMFKLIAKLIINFDDSEAGKKKKGGLKRLLKFKKKTENNAQYGPDIYEDEEEEPELPQIPASDGSAIHNNVRKEDGKKEKKKEKKKKKKEKKEKREAFGEICTSDSSDCDLEVQQLLYLSPPPQLTGPIFHPGPTPRSASPNFSTFAGLAPPLPTIPSGYSSSSNSPKIPARHSPIPALSSTPTTAPLSTSTPLTNPSSLLSSTHSTTSQPSTTPTLTPTQITSSNGSFQETSSSFEHSPSLDLMASTKVVGGAGGGGTSAFELIHFMTELKALLIQNKDYTSLQTQMLSEREQRLALEKQVMKLEHELLQYKQKFGDL